MAVALSLTRYAYYSNLHQDAPRLSDLVYLLLCPPSIGLMATENASVPGQAFIVTVVGCPANPVNRLRRPASIQLFIWAGPFGLESQQMAGDPLPLSIPAQCSRIPDGV
jgi:hypothetical protein